LVSSDGAPGAPGAGRLVAVDNGFGATTSITYRSIKADAGVHQVPSSEIVVDSVTTNGGHDLGGTVSTVRYAYGGAELLFDPAYDAFIFPGYRRRVELQDAVAQPAGMGTAIITDTYAPVSAENPYGLAINSNVPAAQRYAFWRRLGRVSDITVVSGDLGASRLATPRMLLDIDVQHDAHVIAGVHYEWGARLLAAGTDPAGAEPCSEMVFPYNFANSKTFDDNHTDHVDACTAHGFAFMSSTDSWRSNPGAAPPSTASVETRSEVVT